MNRRCIYVIIFLLIPLLGHSQERTVQNRPYTDLRPFHLGVLVGTHFQDLELRNAGIQRIANEDGTTTDRLISVDQDRWDPGFSVGVLGELRLHTNFQLRMAPTMYFGTRHIVFHDQQADVQDKKQTMKTVYIGLPGELIFAAPRCNNYRPYIVTGINPVINLSGKNEDYLKLKRYDVFAEIGLGCDFYLPFFKLRPELKFMYSLTNSLDPNHASHVRDKAILPYVNAVNRSHAKIIALTFYFE